MDLAPGTKLAHYEVLAPLGQGGMGQVFSARDTKLDREVALKLLPAELGTDAKRLQRLEQEARTLARLNHPNIVTIYSVEEAGVVKVLDFGLAKFHDGSAGAEQGANEPSGQAVTATALPRSITDAGTVMGTAPYMSPEQARGEAVDHRARTSSRWACCCTRWPPGGCRSRAKR